MAKWNLDKLDAALSPVAVKVKSLEWDDASCGSWSQSQTGAGWEYLIRNMSGYFVMPFPWKPPERFPTFEAAKAAAQADYEARILSALSPDTPTPEAIVRAALERAAIQVEQGTLGLKGWLDTVRDVQMFMAKNIRALASDPETVADIIEAAKGEP